MSNNQLVRYKKGKVSFEIITKPGTVRLFLANKLGWDKVLATDAVFTNYKKANLAKSSDLKATFGTDDINKCAEIIVREGDAQVSAKERKEDIEAHHKQVITYLHRSYVDQTGGVYTISRLELILAESKVQIDPSVSVQKISENIIKRMLGKAVFKRNSIDYTVSAEKKYYKELSSIMHRFSPGIHKEIRGKENISWKVSILMADMNAFTVEMNKVTEGDYKMNSGHEN